MIVLPGSSWWPLTAAIATGGFFSGILLKWYGAALVSLAITVALFLCWAWSTGSRIDTGELKAREGVHLPLHFEHAEGAPGWHGTLYTLIADAAILGSLVFGTVYLWVVAPGWPPPVYAYAPVWTLIAAAVCWLLALAGARLARENWNARPQHGAAMVGLLLHWAALVGLLGVVGWSLAGLPPAVTHAQSAVTTALLWYAAIHLGVALLMSGFLLTRWRSGFVSARRSLEPRVVWLFTHYSLGSALLCLALAAAQSL